MHPINLLRDAGSHINDCRLCAAQTSDFTAFLAVTFMQFVKIRGSISHNSSYTNAINCPRVWRSSIPRGVNTTFGVWYARKGIKRVAIGWYIRIGSLDNRAVATNWSRRMQLD
jgi:hypothetical protein